MAHHPMFGPDPAKPASSAAEGRVESGTVSPAARTVGESDLAELAAKFTAHGGGRVPPELSADLALEVVLNEIVEQACLATGASGAAIVLARGGEWVCRASAGGNAPQLGARLDSEAGLSGACVKTRKVQRCDDAQADPRADMEACRNLGVRSVIILPLLLNDEMAGVFEVFSSRPTAFGERDERTLEALSQRVLKNLERALEPLSAAVEPAEATRPIVENFVVGNIEAESIAAESIAAESMDATSDGDHGSLDRPLLQPASEAASGRGINFITWVLGAAVLAFAVLLAVLAGQRLVGRNDTARAHPPAAISAPLTGAEKATAASGGATEAAASLTSRNRSESRPSGTSASGSASVSPTAGAAHATDPSPPAGSLLVYENGKEVFRLPPTGGQQDLPPVRESEVERASAVEPDRAIEVSAASAEDRILHRVEPEYPEEARQKGIQGPVVVDVYIDRDGRVVEAKMVSGSPLLAQAVMDAVKRWVFKPHSVNGHPVQMQTRITLNFRLPH